MKQRLCHFEKLFFSFSLQNGTTLISLRNFVHIFQSGLQIGTNSLLVCSKNCEKLPLSKKPKIGFQYQLSHNAGQKFCRMLTLEHSAILLTFIKLPMLPFVIKILVLTSSHTSFVHTKQASRLLHKPIIDRY